MPFGLFDAIVPTTIQIAESVRALLDKAEAFCAEGTLTEAELVQARLIDDMFPFAFQIGSVALHSLGAIEAARTGAFVLHVDTPLPATLAEMKTLMDRTLDGLKAVTRDEMEAMIGRDLAYSIPAFNVARAYAAEDFLLSYSQPNFYFHATTAYDILRSRGVSVGKRDFMGAVRCKA